MTDEQIQALKESAKALQAMSYSLSQNFDGVGMIWWTANNESVWKMKSCLEKLHQLKIDFNT